MPSLEKIVRPFQVGDVFRARRLPPNQLPFEIPTDEPITWEGRADGTFRDKLTGREQCYKFDWSKSLDNATNA
jgi:hypothetical protein